MSTAIETPYTPLIIATAPESSGQILEKIQESFSFIPNLMAIFGNNPTVLEGYSAPHAIYNEGFSRPGKVNRFCWWQTLKPLRRLRSSAFHSREGAQSRHFGKPCPG